MNTLPPVPAAAAPAPCDKHQAFRDLSSAECACGQPKRRMVSFCHRCYFQLPAGLRQDLYNPKSDYVTPYARSLAHLGLRSLSARQDKQLAAAIAEGTRDILASTLSQEASAGASASKNTSPSAERTS